jgi:hypothetical protein
MIKLDVYKKIFIIKVNIWIDKVRNYQRFCC